MASQDTGSTKQKKRSITGFLKICKKKSANCSDEETDSMAVEKAQNGDLEAAKEPKEYTGREKFAKKIDFLLACVGGSIGLGNVWRFPYLCYKNGGGAFLIPYFLAVVLAGAPCFFLEVAVGQFMGVSGVKAWRLCPVFQGFGVTQILAVAFTAFSYCVILAWCFYYFFASMNKVVPWSHCNHARSSVNCTVNFKYAFGLGSDNGLNVSSNYSVAANSTNVTTSPSLDGYIDAAADYWERGVLNISPGIDHPGKVKWDLALCLLLAWVVTFLCICKGIKSSGKVMYVTATSPFVLMFALLIRGCTLPGALEGIKYYMIPKWHMLADPTVWVDAGTQVFFSFALSRGMMTTLGSYNEFNHNSYRDVLVFTFCNCGTSILAGFVIFTVLGYMSVLQNIPLDKVAKSGPGLAFIAYPTALTQLPISPLWSAIFFLMLIMLGLDSLFVNLEGIYTPIIDFFPVIRQKKWGPTVFNAVMCCLLFLLGLCMVTEGGMYVFQIMDFYAASRLLVLSAILECIAVAWFYGIRRFYDNLEMMFGYRINPWMGFCWTFATPVYSIVLFIMSIVIYSDLKMADYTFPKWSITMGWVLAIGCFASFPLYVLNKFRVTPGTFRERVAVLMRPRLHPHQMRECDDPRDMITPEEEDDEHMKAKLIAAIADLKNGQATNGDMGLVKRNNGTTCAEEKALLGNGHTDDHENGKCGNGTNFSDETTKC